MPKPDQQIIAEIRQGNQATFRWVFDTHYDKLCQYAFTILKNMDEAEDIVQAMFIKIWEQRDNMEITQSVQSYLFRSVYNRSINQLEHRGIVQKYEEHGKYVWRNQVQMPETFPQELEDNIKLVIDKLPPQCRAIFMMSRYEELRYSEIAKKLNISVNTIENQISKALRILREELKDVLILFVIIITW